MSLTGPVFLGLVAAATVAAFVALVVLWPRLAGHEPGHILARAGLLLAVNILVLFTAATQLNAQFLFFAGWSDLRGALGGSTSTTSLARGGSAKSAANKPVAGGAAAPKGGALPAVPGDMGPDGVIGYTVRGPLSGITASVVVQLPPGYTDPSSARARYPVIETFQGYPGAPTQWIRTMRLGGAIADAVTAHRLRSAIIVSPQAEIPHGVDTECVNGSAGRPQLETWLTRDVPNWIARTFRVVTTRSSWATMGYSTGGWCAAMAAMLHPAQYGAAVVMGGYFRPDFGTLYEPYPRSSPLQAHYDLIGLAQRTPPPVAIWLETSHADPLSYTSSAGILRRAKPPLAIDATVLEHAGHRTSVWQGLLPRALAWLGQNAAGFSPRI